MTRMKTLLGTFVFAVAAAGYTGCGSDDPTTVSTSEQALGRRLGAQLTPQTRPRLNAIACVGQAVTYTGDIIALGGGAGMTIDTGAGLVTVLGLGPPWYWRDYPVDRPVIGDTVSVEASAVTTSTDLYLLSVTTDGVTVDLRDPTTCLPLW